MTTPLAPRSARAPSVLRDFFRSEAAGGILLMMAAALALLVANTPLAPAYFEALHAEIGPLSVQHWINDALMALFFLLVGLEIKREFLDGELADAKARRLPVIAAVSGMAVPALVYLAIAGGDPALVRGWAIPSATDIAFALGVLALLGSRAPISLKLFLTTVAIVDDLGAVLVIALAYTDTLDWRALALAGALMLMLVRMNRRRVTSLPLYLFMGALLWIAVYRSGVHATVAGVLLALAIPLRTSPGRPDDPASPLHRLEHALQPWVAYLIVPLFGFANAGVSLAGIGLGQLLAPVPLGVAAGLFLGKQIGVFGAVRGAVALGIASRPAGASWTQVYGVALLCGIGFTMSLFIGALAFSDPLLVDEVKIGVLGGSLLSAVVGMLVLRLAPIQEIRC